MRSAALKYILDVYTEATMGKQHTAKTFKSGNSVALRLPAALGVKPGVEMCVNGDADNFDVKRAPEVKRKLDVDAIWGIAPGLRLLTPEEREFEERPSARTTKTAQSD